MTKGTDNLPPGWDQARIQRVISHYENQSEDEAIREDEIALAYPRPTMNLYQVDAFTNKPFGGNPAAVCILDAPRPAEWMQALAAEMNLSETAFLLRQGADWNLRWFTPKVEVKLCGHATLASAHTLWESGLLPADQTARFHTLSGLLTAQQRDGWIEMDFPLGQDAPVETPPPGLAEALGVEPVCVRDTGRSWLAELDSAEQVRELRPDFRAMLAVPRGSVIVTAAADDPEFDFVSRFFAPGVGIDEDPVTGSAHCSLGAYWSGKLGKTRLSALQISARGGILRLEVAAPRIHIAGQAVTVLRGQLNC